MQYFMISPLATAMLFAATMNGRWTPGIGDPTPMGWMTTLAYVLAGLLCVRAAWVTLRTPPVRLGRRAPVFWLFSGMLMLFLAVNKQLDLQTFFTELGRDWAKADGWYETRQAVQVWFIRGLTAVGVIGLLCAAWFIRGARLSYYLALTGLLFTGCFVVIRAASVHHVDVLLGYEVGGVRMNWLFELGGIFVVAASALAFRDGRQVTLEEGNSAAIDAEEVIPPKSNGVGKKQFPSADNTFPSLPPLPPEPTTLPVDSALEPSRKKSPVSPRDEVGNEEGDDGHNLPEIIIL